MHNKKLTDYFTDYLHVIYGMDVQEGLSTLNHCRPKFLQIFNHQQTYGGKVLKIFTLKC